MGIRLLIYRKTDCHNQSADWFRNDEEGIAKYESFDFLHYNGYLRTKVNKLLIVLPQFVNRQVFLAKMPVCGYDIGNT